MTSCKNCRELENELILKNTLIEAIHRVINGKEVSDFELSFPAIREVADIMASQSIHAQDATKPCAFCSNFRGNVYCGNCGRKL